MSASVAELPGLCVPRCDQVRSEQRARSPKRCPAVHAHDGAHAKGPGARVQIDNRDPPRPAGLFPDYFEQRVVRPDRLPAAESEPLLMLVLPSHESLNEAPLAQLLHQLLHPRVVLAGHKLRVQPLIVLVVSFKRIGIGEVAA